MALATLLAIKQKVRRLTRMLSESQLTELQLLQYINTYIQYDFPETLRLFNLKSTFTFYTLPYVDTYSTTTNDKSALYDFKNKYITTNAPAYIAGYQAMFSESREQFYRIYPPLNSVASIGTAGDGTTSFFTGVINTAQSQIAPYVNQRRVLLQNNVLFSSVDSNNNGLAMADSPILDLTTGNPTNFGLLYDALAVNGDPVTPLNPNGKPVLSLAAPYESNPSFPSGNFINYVTGEYYVSFSQAPAAGAPINSQTVTVNPSRPQAILFYDGDFVIRPVPDQSYRVDLEVFVQPTQLLLNNQAPELDEWWQLIAYSAAKKIFEDRMDYESINMMMPSLKEQERLVLRRTIVQQTNQRVATIYSGENSTGPFGSGFGNNTGGLF